MTGGRVPAQRPALEAVCKHSIYIRMNNLNILELKLIILPFYSDDLYETGLSYKQRLHRLTGQKPGVSFWDSDNVMTRHALFSIDDLHPSHEGNAVLHLATASRIQQLFSPDSRRGFVMSVQAKLFCMMNVVLSKASMTQYPLLCLPCRSCAILKLEKQSCMCHVQLAHLCVAMSVDV